MACLLKQLLNWKFLYWYIYTSIFIIKLKDYLEIIFFCKLLFSISRMQDNFSCVAFGRSECFAYSLSFSSLIALWMLSSVLLWNLHFDLQLGVAGCSVYFFLYDLCYYVGFNCSDLFNSKWKIHEDIGSW